MSVYRKYQEVQRLNPPKRLVNKVEKNIWKPDRITNQKTTIKEIERLEPIIEFVEDDLTEFNILRVKSTTMEWSTGPGRLIRSIVRNKSDGRYIGILTFASDFRSLKPRDDFIGWRESEKRKKLRNLAVVSTCHATQPLGFNFLGGKLIASLATTSQIREKWKERYDDTLVGLTTTSLFGKFSMYDRIPYWKPLGETSGQVFIKPDDEYYEFWSSWVKKKYPDEHKDAISRSSPKQNVIRLVLKYLGISQKDYMTNHKRGIYFSDFYENGREFLCGEIKKSKLVFSEKFNGDVGGIVDWWKPKAIKRYQSLVKGKRINPDTLWYDEMNGDVLRSWLQSRGVVLTII